MSSTSGVRSAAAQRLNATLSAAPGPALSMASRQMRSTESSPSVRLALSANWDNTVRMPSATLSRIAWPASTFAYTQRKSPAAPPFNRSRSASSAEVLPVWRGACSTKYFLSRTRPSTVSRSIRSSGGMQ